MVAPSLQRAFDETPVPPPGHRDVSTLATGPLPSLRTAEWGASRALRRRAVRPSSILDAMEGLLTKLADVTYDFVGVLMPGLALLLVGLFQWHVYHALGARDATWVTVVASLGADIALVEKHAWSSFVGVLIVSYLSGRAVLLVARNGFPVVTVIPGRIGALIQRLFGAPVPTPRAQWKKTLCRVTARLFLVSTPKGLLSGHDPALKPLVDYCALQLAPDTAKNALDTWRSFQLVSTRMIEQKGLKSRFQIHQYKYTLDRSLATVFAFGFWSAVALLIMAISRWRLISAEAAMFLFLLYVFDDEHAFHWRLWADVVVADTYAAVCGSKK